MKTATLKKVGLYTTVALLSAVVFLVIYAPANIAFRSIQDDISVPDLTIYQLRGTIWNASAILQFRDFPESTVTTWLSPWPLLSRIARVDIKAGGIGHELDAVASAHDDTVEITAINGFIDSDYINTVGSQFGIRFSGQLDLSDVSLAIDNSWFTDADGQLTWNGGQVMFPAANGSQAVRLPALRGELFMENQQLTLLVSHDRLTVLTVALKADGWVTLTITTRLLALAKVPWPATGSADDAALIIEEKIL
jgi:hypothetical protein